MQSSTLATSTFSQYDIGRRAHSAHIGRLTWLLATFHSAASLAIRALALEQHHGCDKGATGSLAVGLSGFDVYLMPQLHQTIMAEAKQ